ncbi:MAG: hypothetical protein IJH07_08715 [Ruminococcus sp.]|nr:hypothetical protein [Ruminococcus sp.]
MKKNKMMRIAAVLLIVTLLSTCAISGTFAKYVARADMEDSARVAKWGIKIETSGSLFSEKYEAEDEDYIAAGGTYSVEADNGEDKLVAPGTGSYTFNEDGEVTDMGFTAVLSGKPEVATRFALNLTGLQDVYMPFADGYTDYSVAVKDGVEETFDLKSPAAFKGGNASGLNNEYVYGYSPVKWDVRVTRVKDDGTDGRSISLSEMAASVAGQQFGELYQSLFTNEGISITDAKTIVEQVKARGLESMIMDKVNQQFANHGFRNLQITIDDDQIVLAMDFDPNENCNYRFEGGWTWAYEQAAPSFLNAYAADYTEMCDKADTYLGNVAAGIIDDDTVSTDLGFSFIASATQID